MISPKVTGSMNMIQRFRRSIGSLAGGKRTAPENSSPDEDAAKLEEAIGPQDAVTDYWTDHNVTLHHQFKSVQDSLNYLEWRNRQYIRLSEIFPSRGRYDGLRFLDLGCGPGHDLVDVGVYSRPKVLIGVDVSKASLTEAQARFHLHDLNVELFEHDVQGDRLPIPDGSIDVVRSSGVLHHMPDPRAALREARRLLKDGGILEVMVYNRDSLWFNLYVPYSRQIENDIDADVDITEAFRRSTDGPGCPISVCYSWQEFRDLVEPIGFELIEFSAAVSCAEMIELPKRYAALLSQGLAKPHGEFLSALTFDDRGLPIYGKHHAGIDGCYKFRAV